LNITEDHLDRYDYKFENYINSKFRIIQNATSNDYFIYNADDEVITNKLQENNITHKHITIFYETRTNQRRLYTWKEYDTARSMMSVLNGVFMICPERET
jgi:UDP-N-acetylmuramoylalanine-D-glutamate ligase